MRDFEVEVDQAHSIAEAEQMLAKKVYDLVTVNRIIDRDGSEGMDLIRFIKSNTATKFVPVMLVSNHTEHQEAAQKAGAEPGFGKRQLRDPATRQLLEKYFTGQSQAPAVLPAESAPS